MGSSPWPYRSYADRRWLDADRSRDRTLTAVVRSLRTCVADAGDPVGAEPEALLAGVRHLTAIAERVDWAMLSLVGEARAVGVSWAVIGQALGVSKQAAQQRFAPYVRAAMEQADRSA